MTRLQKTRGLVRLILIGTALLVLNGVATGQAEREDIAIAQSLFTKSKKSTISAYLEIDNSDKNTSFWKLYDQYETKRKTIVTERLALLKEYLENYYTIDDTQAASLAVAMLASEERMNALDKKYFKSFKHLVGGVQAVKLFQIEMYVQTAMQATVQANTPVLGELQKLGITSIDMSEF